MALSDDRAAAVVAALTTDYEVERGRMDPHGRSGPLAPPVEQCKRRRAREEPACVFW